MSSPTPAPEIIEQNGQKLALVATIKTVAANREFQNNVNVVQQQRNDAVDLKKRLDQALTAGEKDALQKRLDEILKSLDSNNAIMVKTYGFSLLRNYVISFVKTRLFTPLNDEEFAKLPPEEKAKPDSIKTIEGKVYAYIASIDGIAENDIFRQNVQLVQTQRTRLVQLKQALDKTTSDEDKKKLQEEFDKSETVLKNNNDEMVKRYGFSLIRNYLLEVEESRLYTALSDEEAKKANTDKPEAPAEAPVANQN
ncbi:MAG: hypothetical protein LBV54_01200 [Puniceicoccales bacterium]|jgi:uncharacterized membrane protein YhiD involved in acid resistance|nr:hypothetical protein [Puniceicoccales bacterium]